MKDQPKESKSFLYNKDKKLGAIPQPERIVIDLLTAENRYEFAEIMTLAKDSFLSFVDYCIRDSISKGFHVISVKLKPKPITDDDIVTSTRTLILKVALLPKPTIELLWEEQAK